MRHVLLATVSILSFSLTSTTFAASAEDAAYNKNDKPIYDSAGNCVRTMWHEPNDPCAPAPPPEPAPAPVAAAPAPAPAPAPVVIVPVVSREARTVYFEFNKTGLTADAKVKLDQLADIINKASAITNVSIHGFTDQIGTESYNAKLAHARAQSVKKYLDVKARLAATEGDIRGLGKAAPEAECKGLKKRADKINCMTNERRVEIEFNATTPVN